MYCFSIPPVTHTTSKWHNLKFVWWRVINQILSHTTQCIHSILSNFYAVFIFITDAQWLSWCSVTSKVTCSRSQIIVIAESHIQILWIQVCAILHNDTPYHLNLCSHVVEYFSYLNKHIKIWNLLVNLGI